MTCREIDQNEAAAENWVVERHEPESKPFPMLAEMFIEPGTVRDWDALHQFHYKAAGATMGPKYYRVVCGDMLAGVVVMVYPRGLLKDRHKAFPNMKPGSGDTKISNVYRYKWINKTFGLNARTVNDTLFRGIGVGYRMLNLAARMHGREYCEIQSSMSKFNSFAHRAGFRFVKPTPSALHDEAIGVYARWFEGNPVDQIALMRELEAMHPAVREKAIAALREFYWHNSSIEQTGRFGRENREPGGGRVARMGARDLIRNINQLAFSMPLYGVYKNPDFGRELPSRLPLLAFDQQGVNEPLKLNF